MSRKHYTFAEFKKFIVPYADGGYYPVYSALAEDDNSNKLRTIQLDMICEWRLPDGKVIFAEVDFETEDELNQILDYLRLSAEFLNKDILKRINKISFPPEVPEEDEE